MKQNHPSNHKDTEEDYFSEKEDVDENSDDDGNKNDENQGIQRPVLVPGTKQMTRHFFFELLFMSRALNIKYVLKEFFF